MTDRRQAVDWESVTRVKAQLKNIIRIGVALSGVCLNLLAFDFVSDPASAAEKVLAPSGVQKPPRVEYLWVEPDGKVVRNLWKRQGTWLWQESSEFPGMLRPILRSWIQLPAGYRFLEFQSDELALNSQLDGSPFPAGGPPSFVVESERVRATGLVTLQDNQGKVRQLGLVIRMLQDEPMVWTHSSCQSLGLNLQSVRPASQDFLMSFAYCKDEVDEVQVLLGGSADSRLQEFATYSENSRSVEPLVTGEDRAPNPRARVVSIRKADFKKISQGTLYDWELAAEDGSAASAESRRQYALVLTRKMDPQIRSTGVYLGSGLNFSYLGYQEDPGTEGELLVNQTALTFKVATGYRLASGKWDFGLSSFVNLVSVLPSYGGDDELVGDAKVKSRFYGINGRVSYRLTSEYSPWEWRVAAGPYFWGMLVPQDENGDPYYGVRMLFGPQLFVSLRNFQRKDRNWGIYGKYAITGETASLSSSNFEGAIGGDYQVGRFGKFPLSVTLDFSRVTFSAESVNKSMVLQSVSLGVQSSL